MQNAKYLATVAFGFSPGWSPKFALVVAANEAFGFPLGWNPKQALVSAFVERSARTLIS